MSQNLTLLLLEVAEVFNASFKSQSSMSLHDSSQERFVNDNEEECELTSSSSLLSFLQRLALVRRAGGSISNRDRFVNLGP